MALLGVVAEEDHICCFVCLHLWVPAHSARSYVAFAAHNMERTHIAVSDTNDWQIIYRCMTPQHRCCMCL
jgi:hypothetical protein